MIRMCLVFQLANAYNLQVKCGTEQDAIIVTPKLASWKSFVLLTRKL